MMTVSPYVVEPGRRISFYSFFPEVWAFFAALVVLYACSEFHRGIYGPVMDNSLLIKPSAETVMAYQVFMVQDCPKMAPKIVP